MRVSAFYHTLALGFLRGLSEFCGKRDAAKTKAAKEEKTGMAAKERKKIPTDQVEASWKFPAESGLQHLAGPVPASAVN